MTSMPANQSNKASDRQKEKILEQTKKTWRISKDGSYKSDEQIEKNG